MFLPGLLLVLTCLQTFTRSSVPAFRSFVSDLDYVQGDCCSGFQSLGNFVQLIEEYKVTDPDCPKPGIIFTLKNQRYHHLYHLRHRYSSLSPFYLDDRPRVCANPDDKKVQSIVNRIDRLRMDSYAPQLCCFRFHAHPIPARLITGYQMTDHQCNSSGVIFILKDNQNFCVDPKKIWVQNIMRTSDQTEKSQELVCHYGRGPGHWCFSFYDYQIPLESITGYEETAHHSPHHGVIFTLKDGRRVCTDHNKKWVKNHMRELDNQMFKSL